VLIGGPDGREVVGVAHGEWYRIITAAFLHGGPIHLAFNMIALWQAGTLLEGRVGRLRFGLIYVVAVLGGGFGALLLSPERFAVGASGGVFGLFGALFVAERKGMFGRAGSSFGLVIAINLFLTVAIPGISLGGHLGGLAAGTVVGWAMIEYQSRGLPKTAPLALAAALGVALFAGCLWAATLSSDPLYRV
jgi:membrane associated rhomboid family serine protease